MIILHTFIYLSKTIIVQYLNNTSLLIGFFTYLQKTLLNIYPMCRWLLRRGHTRSHSELGSQALQRRWYFVLRHGRVGRCRHKLKKYIVMKVVSSLKSHRKRDLNSQLVRRKRRIYIINKKNPKFKVRQR